MINEQDLKSIYGHDGMIAIGAAPPDALAEIDRWCSMLQRGGYNPQGVTTSQFDAVMAVNKAVEGVPFPVMPTLNIVFKHKKTAKAAGVDAYPKSHYPTVQVLVDLAADPS